MASSPFHGIFSALNAGASKGKFSWEEEEAASKAVGDTAGGRARPDDPQVGRVAVDIFEFDGYYIIKAPIAGVRMADLDIEVDDNVLTIRGQRRQTDNVAVDQYYLQECFWGPFSRSVTLPAPIDPRKVRATFNKDSVLKIFVPKEDKIKIVKIQEA